MEQNPAIQGGRPLAYTFAWKGRRYCDLNRSRANLNLIKEDMANGAAPNDFMEIIAHLVDKRTGCIVLSEDISLDDPMTLDEVVPFMRMWLTKKLLEVPHIPSAAEQDQEPRLVDVEVVVKGKED